MPRKRRNKIDKTKIDFMKPVDITMFGSKDDPCFGKLYSPTASECQRCGDCEICAIVTAQKAKVIRTKVEEKSSFKDLEEVDIEVKRSVKNLVITNKITSYKEVVILIKKKFKYKQLEEAKTKTKNAIKALKYKIIKKDGKRYIRINKA
jgi:hypothetical protein